MKEFEKTLIKLMKVNIEQFLRIHLQATKISTWDKKWNWHFTINYFNTLNVRQFHFPPKFLLWQ